VPVTPQDVEAGTVHVVPYNDIERLDAILAEHAGTIACVFVEPVLENLGIVLPDAGYLAAVREACDRHGVLLVFDEVKTGLTAGWPDTAVDYFNYDAWTRDLRHDYVVVDAPDLDGHGVYVFRSL